MNSARSTPLMPALIGYSQDLLRVGLRLRRQRAATIRLVACEPLADQVRVRRAVCQRALVVRFAISYRRRESALRPDAIARSPAEREIADDRVRRLHEFRALRELIVDLAQQIFRALELALFDRQDLRRHRHVAAAEIEREHAVLCRTSPDPSRARASPRGCARAATRIPDAHSGRACTPSRIHSSAFFVARP